MNPVFLFALVFALQRTPCSEAGLIKKVITGIVGDRQPSDQNQNGNSHADRPQQNSFFSSHGGSSSADFHDSQTSRRPDTGFGGHAASHQNYKNTSSHIVDGDYLTSNQNPSGQLGNRPRPESGYGGGGTYHKKPVGGEPYKNTTAHIEDEDYLTPNRNESDRNKPRPSTEYGGGGTYTIKPGGSNSRQSQMSKRSELPGEAVDGHSQELTLLGKNGPELDSPPTESEKYGGSATATHGTGSNTVTLHSDSVTCLYSNVNEPEIEKRSLVCNETDCHLEKNSDKSSLWLCEKIKCTVANVDFGADTGDKKLMECTMDGRNIIQVQDRVAKCGPDEKEHNGRCRKVFGS